MEQAFQPGAVVVPPTAPDASGRYSDISLTNLFLSYIHLINSERQAIWQRYQTMLLGNSILLGLVLRAERVTAPEVVITVLGGLFLCVAWWLMTTTAWKLFRMWTAEGLRFSWQNFQSDGIPVVMTGINPLEVSKKYREDTSQLLFKTARGVIVLFMLGYLFMFFDYFILQPRLRLP